MIVIIIIIIIHNPGDIYLVLGNQETQVTHQDNWSLCITSPLFGSSYLLLSFPYLPLP